MIRHLRHGIALLCALAVSVPLSPFSTADVVGAGPPPGSAIDVAFVIDGSSSISASDFDLARIFSKRVLQSCLFAHDAQAAVVQFADAAQVEQPLTAQTALLTDAIDQMAQIGPGTDIREAIDTAQAQLAAGRPSAFKLMILLTDGGQSVPGDPLASADAAKAAGTEIFTVGVGDQIDAVQLAAIASDPDAEHMFSASDYDSLEASLTQTTGATCGTPPVTPGRYTPLDNPQRIVDTRTGPGPVGKLAVDGEFAVTVAGVAGVPATATAVLLNTTVTQTDAQGFLTVWGCGSPRPNASNLNYVANDEAANLVAVKVGSAGQVCFSAGEAATHLVVDVSGYFDNSGSLYNAVAPERFVDTRIGGAKVQADGTLAVTVAGVGSVPANATSVILNATVNQPGSPGFLTVWPCGTPRPLASNVNFSSFDVANLVAVRIGSDGQVCFSPNQATHVIADVMGWFGATGDAYEPVFPTRGLDTRLGGLTTVAPGEVERLRVVDRSGTEAGIGGTPQTASAVMVNVTVDGPRADGYFTVWPCDVAQPYVSNINYRANDTVPNLAAVKIGTTGEICMASFAETNVIVDVVGFFSSSA